MADMSEGNKSDRGRKKSHINRAKEPKEEEEGEEEVHLDHMQSRRWSWPCGRVVEVVEEEGGAAMAAAAAAADNLLSGRKQNLK